MWLCEQHNLVNEKLGKELFMCDMKTLDERWRKSNDPKCQS
jgi:FAD-linked sulfhydryl oxidase